MLRSRVLRTSLIKVSQRAMLVKSIALFYCKSEKRVKNTDVDEKNGKFNVNLGVEICDRFLYTFNKILKAYVGCECND